jgi:hypothetical protein
MPSLIKDLRTLLWPAAAILTATVMPLAWGSNADEANALGGWSLRLTMVAFVLGTSLLVALPFGAEFQQRTLVLLLSQPVTRAKVWTQKWGTLLAVLLLLLVVQYAVLTGGTVPAHVVFTFVALMACSGPLWTLVAGSTIGGAVFSLAALLLIEVTASLSIAFVTGSEIELFANRPTFVVVRAAYAALTLWLGWRTFARYEVTGGGDGPGGLAIGSLRGFEILRSRPHGAVANLVRKELRLQQPTFLIAAVFIVCWLAALLVLAFTPERPDVADVVLTVLLVSYVPLSLIVASTISVGEETSLGIHAWHLTYPVSSAAQWFVKIGVTVAVAAALGVALPLGLAASVPAAVVLPAGGLQLPSASAAALLAVSVSLVGFWTSTLARQTVRAAVMTGVALAVFAFVIGGGGWLGWRVGTGTQLFTWIMVQWQLPPESLHPFAYGLTSRRLEWLAPGIALCLLTPLALRQSLAAFRTARIDRHRIVRYSAQLGMVALLAGFIPAAGIRASGDVYRSQPVRELELALAHVATRSMGPSTAEPVSLSLAELDAAGLLSERTRRWLDGARISLQLRPYTDPAGQEIRYLQTRVTFPNGRESRMLSRLPDR